MLPRVLRECFRKCFVSASMSSRVSAIFRALVSTRWGVLGWCPQRGDFLCWRESELHVFLGGRRLLGQFGECFTFFDSRCRICCWGVLGCAEVCWGVLRCAEVCWGVLGCAVLRSARRFSLLEGVRTACFFLFVAGLSANVANVSHFSIPGAEFVAGVCWGVLTCAEVC